MEVAASLQPFQPYHHPSAWTATEMRQRTDWVYHLTPSDVAELLQAADAALASGTPLHEVKSGEHPLPTLGAKLDAIRAEVVHGRGFAVIKGEWRSSPPRRCTGAGALPRAPRAPTSPPAPPARPLPCPQASPPRSGRAPRRWPPTS
jgi:hypothetical protein